MPGYNDWRDRLFQSQNDLTSAYGNWSLGNTTAGGTGDSLTSESLRTAIDAMAYQTLTTPYYGGNSLYGSSGKTEKEKNAVGLKVLQKIKIAAKSMNITENDAETAMSKAEEYRALGLDSIAKVVELKSNRILREMGISAAGYKRINREELNKFQKELDKVSDSTSKRRLSETPLARYVGQNQERTEGAAINEMELGVPPQDVLDKLKTARESKLFDDYAVLHIQYVPDPILCGKINESNDLYFIAEWGDDVKLSDIVKE